METNKLMLEKERFLCQLDKYFYAKGSRHDFNIIFTEKFKAQIASWFLEDNLFANNYLKIFSFEDETIDFLIAIREDLENYSKEHLTYSLDLEDDVQIVALNIIFTIK
ncbi:hypothetical protein [Polaribacter porphyrae]|uniref:Uncharacterized protein n=1 Tax=Polaribacter porphyrae TaxID=1137780 RepID=A0A2S7WP69_9FLAO|nr:hypothetical protein [Polaribacter porphyrae]PQJ79400.1 hypothetical protein BTO18_09545 [Polaribacter porphyrae]